jgi:hypothetical protein
MSERESKSIQEKQEEAEEKLKQNSTPALVSLFLFKLIFAFLTHPPDKFKCIHRIFFSVFFI